MLLNLSFLHSLAPFFNFTFSCQRGPSRKSRCILLVRATRVWNGQCFFRNETTATTNHIIPSIFLGHLTESCHWLGWQWNYLQAAASMYFDCLGASWSLNTCRILKEFLFQRVVNWLQLWTALSGRRTLWRFLKWLQGEETSEGTQCTPGATQITHGGWMENPGRNSCTKFWKRNADLSEGTLSVHLEGPHLCSGSPLWSRKMLFCYRSIHVCF